MITKNIRVRNIPQIKEANETSHEVNAISVFNLTQLFNKAILQFKGKWESENPVVKELFAWVQKAARLEIRTSPSCKFKRKILYFTVKATNRYKVYNFY